MKKLIAITLISFACFIFTACAFKADGEILTDSALMDSATDSYLDCNLVELESDLIVYLVENESTSHICADDNKIVFDNEPHFRSFQTPDLAPWYVSYEIINIDGEIVKSITTDRPMRISHASENILEISMSVGLAIPSVTMVQFYSVKDNIFSDIFETQPFFIKDEIVAHIARLDEGCLVLVVQDIFDSEIFHREFFFEEFSPFAYPSFCTYAEYLGDNRIKVAPLFDADFNEKYVILDLE